MGLYEKHVFVCVTGKVCPTQGSEAVWQELRNGVKAAGMLEKIRVNKSGCLAQCGHGPMMVTYPEATWYAQVTLEDVPEILDRHLLGGQPVERLQYPAPEEPEAGN
ncbi:MAG: (2Fe-2S) ferredoxin domain-containing protein [Blastocatellia bacterium]|nr:(2Fe-2S) ferredoxin domain-containing protein [Blastocatellia bacterium]